MQPGVPGRVEWRRDRVGSGVRTALQISAVAGAAADGIDGFALGRESHLRRAQDIAAVEQVRQQNDANGGEHLGASDQQRR